MKLIAIDLDGTLLNNNGRISAKTADIISEVRSAGHKVVIATGRHVSTALPIVKELQLTDLLVCFNGALIMNLQTEQAKVCHTYASNDIKKLTTLVKEWGYSYLTATQHRYHIEKQYDHLIEHFLNRNATIEQVRHIEDVTCPIFKTSIVGSKEELDDVEQFIQPTVTHLHVIRSGEGAIDVIHPQASKGAALHKLAQYYNVPREHIISFGNYDNDISMLTYAGTGVVVDNAPSHVKRYANHLTTSNEEDGVARFLENHLLYKVPSIKSK